jgi:Spy/CpxP family protein refolding chaperone
MKIAIATLAGLLACSAVLAQTGAASAPSKGMGMGPMHGWRMDRNNTPGWSLMSEAERQAHHDKMRAMTDHAACSAYMEQHHEQMAARAKERGQTLPAMPRRDHCAPLKK